MSVCGGVWFGKVHSYPKLLCGEKNQKPTRHGRPLDQKAGGIPVGPVWGVGVGSSGKLSMQGNYFLSSSGFFIGFPTAILVNLQMVTNVFFIASIIYIFYSIVEKRGVATRELLFYFSSSCSYSRQVASAMFSHPPDFNWHYSSVNYHINQFLHIDASGT